MWIVKIGLWVIPFLPLYISPSMLFPFITGKNFTFRIITELIFVFWVGLAVMNPAYRPRLTLLFKAVTVFTVIVFLADLFSPNPYRSFFSNYERMEGFMMIGHLYLYFVMLVSVFKTRRDWLVFFHVTLAASIAVSLYAILQRLGYIRSIQGGFRVDATIGNPTYLAAYLMYHVWLLLLLLREFWKKRALSIFYGVTLLFELAIIYFSATRGVVLALAGSAILFSFITVLFWNRIFGEDIQGNAAYVQKRGGVVPYRNAGRKVAGIILLLTFLIPVFFWSIRKTEFVQKNQALERLTNYSLNEGTIRARFMIWGMSIKGALDRPILGWGQENYYLVFQKYYNPGLYGEEPWFDRSHDIIFDWLIHAGFLGLFSYLSVIGVVFWRLAGVARKSRVGAWTSLTLIGLFASSFFQNIFVFDNLNTYLLFFGFLGYTEYFLGTDRRDVLDRAYTKTGRKNPLAWSGIPVMIFLFAVVSVWIYFFNIKPIQEGKALIRVLMVINSDGSEEQLKNAFQEALAYDTFGNTEVREQIAAIGREIPYSDKVTQKQKKDFVEFAIDELRKETAHSAKDVKHLLFLGTLITRGLEQQAISDPKYIQEAEAIFKESIKVSPTRQAVYVEAARFYLLTRRSEEAYQAMKKAWNLDKSYREVGAGLWTIAAVTKHEDTINEIKKVHPLSSLSTEQVSRIAQGYQQAQNFPAALEVYRLMISQNPKVAKFHAVLAALLAETGNIQEARREVEETLKLDPSPDNQKEAKQFLEMLRNR
ncbi:MAG: Uncharacterized protein G01um101433_304 [Parcubacteria group bacterium Gr01-1014_33]|nr:MAG: Uncharacterized protein G01um101433_304 [Parcubacteria group bacterium Gr01-1014_33]